MGQILLQKIIGNGFELSSLTSAFLCLLTSWLIWFCFGLRFIKWLYECKIGQKIRMEECPLLGKLHEKKKETPTMGGALLLFSTVISGFIWMDLSHPFTWTLFLTAIGMGSIGAFDDWLKLKWKNTKGLSPKKKMLFQTMIAFFVVFMMSTDGFSIFTAAQPLKVIDFSKTLEPIMHTLSSAQNLFFIPFVSHSIAVPQGYIWSAGLFFFFWFVITGSSNAANLTDGLDGLAGGITILVSLALFGAAYIISEPSLAQRFHFVSIDGAQNIALFLSALIGSCLGFLWYNTYPAQVFMGDTGSLGIGGLLGVSAILMRQEFFLALAGAVFVVETLSVILQVWSFRRYKKRIFLCSPLHHHFEYQGLPETKVVMRFWIIGFVFMLVSLLSLVSRG